MRSDRKQRLAQRMMRWSGLTRSSLIGSGLLLAVLPSGAYADDKPFEQREYSDPVAAPPCKVQEFVCATCGHDIDPEHWNSANQLRAAVEACAKRQAEQQRSD